MILQWLRNRFRKDDNGVSPVVGTILMVAATVAIGATVFAALNSFGGNDATSERVSSLFQVKAVDLQQTSSTGVISNGNDGLMDGIRLTYISGPELAPADIVITMTKADDPTKKLTTTGTIDKAGSWAIYDLTDGAATPSPVNSAGEWYVTILVKNTLVLDTTVKLDQ